MYLKIVKIRVTSRDDFDMFSSTLNVVNNESFTIAEMVFKSTVQVNHGNLRTFEFNIGLP